MRITIHSTDSERALKYYEDRDLPMPIVAILGHHPALYLGTMGLTAYESDDYSSIGSFLGEPLRLVPSETWVRTSWSRPTQRSSSRASVPPHVRMIADPFGDITRQYQAQTLRPVMNVTAITRRSDAILQDRLAGHRDHITVGQIPKEGTLYNTLRKRFGDIITAIHMPYSLRSPPLLRLHQEERRSGQGGCAGRHPGVLTFQTVVVVDDVIDVFDEADVVWAALVNVDPSRDIDVIHNIPNVFTTSIGSAKVLIDATRPHDRTIPPMNRAPRTRWTASTSTTTSTRCTGAISTPTSRASRWNGRSRSRAPAGTLPVDYEIRFMDVELECPACRRKMRAEEAAAVDERWLTKP